jgi:hypothetical protein
MTVSHAPCAPPGSHRSGPAPHEVRNNQEAPATGSTICATAPIHDVQCDRMHLDCAWGRSSQQAIGRGGKSETVDSVQQVVANGRFRSWSDAIGHYILGQPCLQLGGKTSLGTLVDVQSQLPFDCRSTVIVLPLLSSEEDCTNVQVM